MSLRHHSAKLSWPGSSDGNESNMPICLTILATPAGTSVQEAEDKGMAADVPCCCHGGIPACQWIHDADRLPMVEDVLHARKAQVHCSTHLINKIQSNMHSRSIMHV